MADTGTDAKEDVAADTGKLHGGSRSTGTYYRVEVRTTYRDPIILSSRPPMTIDNKWRTWPLTLSVGELHPSPSVPVRSWNAHAAEHGLVTHEVAKAHQWAVFAVLEVVASAFCIETRLVAVEVKETFETREIGVSETLSFPCRPWDDFKPRES